MNKQELIDAIAADTDATKTAVGRFLDSFIENVQGTVAKGDQVTLTGFGTFKRADVAARTGRNPTTGQAMSLPATVKPRFVPGAIFKAKVKG
ncbi:MULTISPECIES: HU family DNA-binding protein [Burkholderiaceae]|jgi:DNA-binding protein HU-beta|uniref:HU family DNA-binding protein n=1 Tax=Ralstonia pickettii TaxID=329 RepID=A0AAW4Q9P2_RALPI|nr:MULTISPECIES: HU family DNA-binding protein [Burkholderiaceae]UCF21829.1 MAG: HU family DNA-binding protein [Ralstonia sp.]MBA9847896.1 HU family DNA-binding protein [Ralstonia pickettii]MBA9853420.1 HU family DNA-binding protein [Ralstonia pickettii]MBA9920949.1 HU family DNA-binding protein [Ralstonia pickettii]MBA9960451.1 HU family DNA-binding protein [Ralstonia pickettii]